MISVQDTGKWAALRYCTVHGVELTKLETWQTWKLWEEGLAQRAKICCIPRTVPPYLA